jgi:hypothetical protein
VVFARFEIFVMDRAAIQRETIARFSNFGSPVLYTAA